VLRRDRVGQPARDNHLIARDGKCYVRPLRDLPGIQDEVRCLHPACTTNWARVRIVVLGPALFASRLEHGVHKHLQQRGSGQFDSGVLTVDAPICDHRLAAAVSCPFFGNQLLQQRISWIKQELPGYRDKALPKVLPEALAHIVTQNGIRPLLAKTEFKCFAHIGHLPGNGRLEYTSSTIS